MVKCILLWIIVILINIQGAISQNGDNCFEVATDNNELLNEFLTIYEDTSNSYTISTITTSEIQAFFFSYNARKQSFNPNFTYWGKLSLCNKQNKLQHKVLSIGSKRMADFVEVYVYKVMAIMK